MSSLNIFLLIILLVSIFYGAYYGFLKIFIFIISVSGSIFLANKFYYVLANFLPFNTFSKPLSYSIIFVFSNFFIKKILNFLINPLENFPDIKSANRYLGAFFMVFMCINLLGIAYNNLQKLSKIKYLDNSKILSTIYNFDNKIYNLLPGNLRKKINNLSNFLPKDLKELEKMINKI